MKKVLIVEDEPSLRRALLDKLSRLNDVIILEASDGESGLALALSDHPQVIVLDVIMPKMDGLTMLKKLREDSWGKYVSVIVLTNVSPNDEQVMNQISASEPSYYFVKANKSIEEVSQIVQELLAKQK